MTRLFIVLLILTSSLMADVISTKGQIKFKTQIDNQADMTLNSTGLGIGSTPSTNLHVNGNAIVSEQVLVGGSSGSSNLNVNGTIGYGMLTVTSSQTLGSSSMVLVNPSSGNISLSLPTANSCKGRVYHIKRIKANEHYVRLTSSDNLDNSNNAIDIHDMQTLMVISDGTAWYNMSPENVATQIVASSNLVGWWKLDETGGNTVLDSSLNGNHGVYEGSIESSIGKISSAISFNGASEQVEIPNESFYDSLTTAITISCWFRVETFDTPWQALVTKGDNSWRVHRHLTGNVLTFTITGTSNSLSATTEVNDGLWHHIAAVYDGSFKYIYIDGVLDNSVASTGTIKSNDYAIGIGENIQHNTREWEGDIDDVRIYNKGLSSSEVSLIYSQGQ